MTEPLPGQPDIPAEQGFNDFIELFEPESLARGVVPYEAVIETQIKDFQRVLQIQHEVPYYNGRVFGYFDGLAQAASSARLPQGLTQGSSFRAVDLIRPRPPGTRLPVYVVERGAGQQRYLQGYRAGLADARDALRQMDGSLLPLGNAGVMTEAFAFLSYLRSQFGASRANLADNLLEEFGPPPLDI